MSRWTGGEIWMWNSQWNFGKVHQSCLQKSVYCRCWSQVFYDWWNYKYQLKRKHQHHFRWNNRALHMAGIIKFHASGFMITASSRNFFSYQAAFYLAEWCIANRQRISGMTVVELGSGAGLVGLTCYKICKPRYVTMTDFHPKVMETLRYNVENNQIITPESTNPPIDIQPLDWMEFYQKNESSLRADLVLASGK